MAEVWQAKGEYLHTLFFLLVSTNGRQGYVTWDVRVSAVDDRDGAAQGVR